MNDNLNFQKDMMQVNMYMLHESDNMLLIPKLNALNLMALINTGEFRSYSFIQLIHIYKTNV
jgi:hypothetical protein